MELYLFDHAPANIETFIEVKPDSFEKCRGFKLLAVRDDFLESHAWFYRKAILSDDGTLIEIHGDEVSRDANDFYPLLVSLAISLGTRKAWQQ